MGPATELDPVSPSRPGGDPASLLGDLRRRRFGVRLSLVGWIQLGIFGACEALFLRGDRNPAHFLPLWGLDVGLIAALLIPRIRSRTADSAGHPVQILIRIWLTCAILCLTSASLNSITGFAIDWFKISWAMLGTFGFATLAWIFHLAFLIPAVAMSLTALMIASQPDHAYLIFGASWCATLQALAAWLELGHRFGRAADPVQPAAKRDFSDA